MRPLVYLIPLLALTGCVSTPSAAPVPKTIPADLSAGQKSAVQGGVLVILKDPMSAAFGQMVAAKATANDLTYYVCGTVNAKNSFGGYAGSQPYFGVLSTIRLAGKPNYLFNVTKFGSRPIDKITVQRLCREYGVTN